MDDLQLLMDDIKEWSDSTFGKGDRTVAILHHLKKEVPELIDALQNTDDTPEAQSAKLNEFADCFLLMFDSAAHYGLSACDIIEISMIKLEINKNRKWGMPDENGVVEHIKEGNILYDSPYYPNIGVR